jgi:hypothetical protein
MKTEEDEAFDDLAKRQGSWGGGYQAKRKMAADKLQEPVAWMVTYQDGSREVVYEAPSNLHPDYSDIPTSITPFYTTPPKRPWVGLTDEEIDAIYWQHENHCGEYKVSIWPYERAIEAKLKEKNNG